MSYGKKVVLLSVAVSAICIALLLYEPPQDRAGARHAELMFYCAAGIKPPVEAAAHRYLQECGVNVQIQYGGSGTLLSNIQVAGSGDLYLAADDSYIEIAREKGLVAESIPLARMTPVIAIRAGNPKGISGVSDLLRKDVAVAIANPDAAAIGKITREVLTRTGEWKTLEPAVKVFKPTVNDVANDIKIGSVDAGIIWDATANQYSELEYIRVPAFDESKRMITVGVLHSSKNPTAALKFARYLGARDRGLPEFTRFGYDPVEGDVWEETPEIVLFSGGVNRLAIEDSLEAFERREGVRVTRVYNGCGILVAQIKTGKHPDAYFACDTSFMEDVKDLFVDVSEVSETAMVILVQKENPKGIRSLKDLARPGLKIGVANPKQSALGALTARLLESERLLAPVMKNVKTQTPTADLLVNQLRTGALDAAIVYEANTALVRDKLQIVRIDHPSARAVQPIAANRETKHPHLARRLMDAIMSPDSKKRFTSVGFQWKAGRREQP